MARVAWRGGRARALVMVGVLVLSAGGDAYAHGVTMFVEPAAGRIVGRVYFRGGGRARGVEVRVLAPDGGSLGKAVTDAAGDFAFTPTVPCDHRFVFDSGDGHRVEATVRAEDLAGPPAGGAPAPHGSATRPAAGDSPPAAAAGLPPADRRDRLEERIRQLGLRIDQYHQTIRLHDVIGGVGYIVGLFGLVCYLKSRRHRRGEGGAD